MSIRIGFTLIGGQNWTGGYNYLLNLLRVLAQEAPGEICPVLFVGDDVPTVELAPFADIAGTELVVSTVLNEVRRSRLLLHGFLLGRDRQFSALLAGNGIDLVFESAIFFGWRLGVPAVAWIPDLQHRYLPELFSRLSWLKREFGFRAQISAGRTLMVSSLDTKSACAQIYPSSRGRVHAVRFAVRSPSPITDAEARSVADRYELPQEYFLMPNQFWMHKNHLLVVRALKILRQRGVSVCVVATGKQLDPRNVGHVPMLKSAVLDAGLSGEFVMPGLIPYSDLMPLMQASVGLLNPSLFEGWSTTVEEARAGGVPMLLSDLSVHREQAGEHASYFNRVSPECLADALASFEVLSPTARENRREMARKDALTRVREFSNDFVALAKAAVAA